MKLKFFAILAVQLGASLVGAQDALQNNGFEQAVATSDFMAALSGTSAVPGWQITGASASNGVNYRTILSGPPWVANRGNQGVQLGGPNGPGGIYQDMVLTEGEDYVLAYGHCGDGVTANDTFAVYFNGQLLASNGQQSQVWIGTSRLVPDVPANARLEFGANFAPNGVILDEVYFFRYDSGLLVGDVRLLEHSGPSTNRPVVVELFNSVGALVHTYNSSLDPSGHFKVNPIATGVFDITVKSSGFLRKRITSTSLFQSVNEKTFTLTNGDVDDSGEVDAADIDTVIAQFGSTDPTNADVDGSAEVDAADIDIVIGNFGAVDE